MCGLFGFINYKHSQSEGFMNTLINSLAEASEVRGTHATGIAYINNGEVEIFKQPKPASNLKFKLSKNTTSVIGHTRHATQGNSKENRNNHPFLGHIKENQFAFAHNGVIYNDKQLRHNLKLPKTSIETDSYIAVQLLESRKDLSLKSHKYMAEQIEGTFTFSTLDKNNNIYITKGSSPISIINFKEIGLFVYASTENILFDAILNTKLLTNIKKELSLKTRRRNIEFIELNEGEIIKISSNGQTSKCNFKLKEFTFERDWYDFYNPFNNKENFVAIKNNDDYKEEYINDLIQFAQINGILAEDVQFLNDNGFSLFEIEELVYDPEVFYEYVYELKFEFENLL